MNQHNCVKERRKERNLFSPLPFMIFNCIKIYKTFLSNKYGLKKHRQEMKFNFFNV